ncbi:MAG: histidine kinase [Ignavibacteriae bacterium]|nr:histidine kinase [Ignavibacteriota bacterium]
MLYMAAWLMIAGLLCVLMVATSDYGWIEAVSVIVPMAALYAFMCLASLYVCRSFPLQSTAFLNVVFAVMVSSALSSAIWFAAGTGLTLALDRGEVFPGLQHRYTTSGPLMFGIGMLLYILGIVIHYLLIAFDLARTAERKALELQVLAREAELKALRSQIQPHFLFNSLNSISALTATDASAARSMSVRLADFFRKTLKLGHEQFIPLADEFALAENFLSIEKVRFGERLAYEKHLSNECESILVPSLILQPMIENAVNHGLAHLISGGTIRIAAQKFGNVVQIRVTNPTDPDRPSSKSTGLGLANVKRRIETLYGNDASFQITNGTDEYSVEMRLPVTTKQS